MKRNCISLGLLAAAIAAGAQVYNNPVTQRSLPDPTVIRGNDGSFYMFATEDTHNVPVMKSTDLVHWNYLRTAFTDLTRPDFVQGAAIWAPDVNEINGNYVLYYSMSTWGGSWDCGIGVATSRRPWGPYADAKKLFISREIGIENCIDPFYIKGDDGKNYLFFGSFHDIYGIELTDDGLSVAQGAQPVKIAGGLIEATYIINHDGYYYLVGSAGSCCEGANSTYRLVVARSKRLFGPYQSKTGGYAKDNSFSELLHGSSQVFGPGHCAEWQVDDNGQYWIIYHGFPASDVSMGRVTYLDKVMWDGAGWPYIASQTPSTESEVPYFKTTDINAASDGAAHYSVQRAEGLYQILIESSDNSPFTWQILTSRGIMARYGQAQHSTNVWTADLSHGVYIVKVSGRHGIYTQKITL